MKVKIIRGYYGYRNSKAVELKDINSPAFELDEAEAKRLIGLGIAKAVSVAAMEPLGECTATDETNMLTGHLTEEQLRTLPYPKLKQLCKELGVSASGKQEELIARLVAIKVEVAGQDEEDIDDSETDNTEGECPPALKAAEPEV